MGSVGDNLLDRQGVDGARDEHHRGQAEVKPVHVEVRQIATVEKNRLKTLKTQKSVSFESKKLPPLCFSINNLFAQNSLFHRRLQRWWKALPLLSNTIQHQMYAFR